MSTRYTSLEGLSPVIEWLVCQRPESAFARFSLFRVGFQNPQVLGNTFGASDAMRRLNQFGNMLASTVRHTDLVARDLTAFWILTPECNADMVGCRLCEIVNGVKQFGLDVVDCSVGAYLFPIKDVDLTGATARQLLDRLHAAKPHFSFDPAHDCAVSWMVRTGNKLEQWQGQIQKNCYRARTEFGVAAPEAAAESRGPSSALPA
jgi:hypothetical protein